MPLPDYMYLAEEIRGRVFGQGTDLHASFSCEEVAEALEQAHLGRLGPESGAVAEAYGLDNITVPEMVSVLAATDGDSLRNTLPSPDRLAKADALRSQVDAFLRDLPTRFPWACPEDFRQVAHDGLYAVIVETEGVNGAAATSRLARVVQETADLLKGESVRVSSPSTGRWRMEYVLQRGCSLSQARTLAELTDNGRTNEEATAQRRSEMLTKPEISPPTHEH